jgi:hypothetical protein
MDEAILVLHLSLLSDLNRDLSSLVFAAGCADHSYSNFDDLPGRLG